MASSNAIYVASAYANREYLKKEILPVLQRLGIQCTSTWIDYKPPKIFEREEKRVANQAWINQSNVVASMDYGSIDKAKAVLFVGDEYAEKGGLGGMWIEFGYALAKGKILIWYGEDLPNPLAVKAHYFVRPEDGEGAARKTPGLVETLSRVYGLRDLRDFRNMQPPDARRPENGGPLDAL